MDFKLTSQLLYWLILFSRTVWGCINNPYSTYRKLSSQDISIGQVVYVFLVIGCYFAWASALRSGIRNPYLLTLRFNSLMLAGSIGFLGMVMLLYAVGRRLGGSGTAKTVSILWSYSLLPTVLWFFATSILYILLPPPRSSSTLGTLYSLIFITCSLALLGWKVILYYLTLRFGMRLDLKRIILVSLVVVPIIGCYAVLMYWLGVTRIPFI